MSEKRSKEEVEEMGGEGSTEIKGLLSHAVDWEVESTSIRINSM